MPDDYCNQADRLISAAQLNGFVPVVKSFFDEATNTASHVVHDPVTLEAAIIDSVLDYDAASGRTTLNSANAIIAYVKSIGLSVTWLLETHAHADHLSAAPYLKTKLGGTLAISSQIIEVQQVFGKLFNTLSTVAPNGSDFEHLFEDGDRFKIGSIEAIALHVPGHTPADLAYVIGDAVFVGDTLFMPDSGTARADFPGGNSGQLFRSIRRLMTLPEMTRMFLCHDYKAAGRDSFAWETTVGAQRIGNVHAHEGIAQDDFVAMRDARDATLTMPKLILPAIQVNICAGRLPEPEANGVRYLKIPLDLL